MTPKIILEEYSHGVRVSGYTRDLFQKLSLFLEGLSLKEPRRLPPNQGGRMVMELKKRFYGLTANHREIFIHRHHVGDLLAYLKDRGIYEQYIQRVQIPVPPAASAKLEVYEHFQARDYQESIIEDLTDDLYSRRLDLYTGYGKTLCSLMAAAKLGKRVVIMIPPKYFGIWEKALRETYKHIDGRYVTVSGSGELQVLINRGLEGTLDYDVILISNVTYRMYLEAYERHGKDIEVVGYNVPPPRFHEAIGAGVQINDEIQEDPGLVFRTDIFSNVAKQIYLSATPYTGSEYVTRMIDVMLPPFTQCKLPEYKKYINVVGLLYSDPGVKSKDYLTPFKNTYNHARYEKRMLRNKRRLDAYFKMIRRIAEGIYVRDRQPGQKLLILCAYVEFIKELTRYLQQQFPQLKVRSYVSGTPYKELLENDITVSTIKSSGTGVDIPNLREVLLCQATDSKKDNVQILGRTRPLKDFPDVSPRLVYLVCTEIPQHVRYHNAKKDYFSGRALTHRVMRI